MFGKLERKRGRSCLSLRSRALCASAAKLDFNIVLVNTRQTYARCDFGKLVLAGMKHNLVENRLKISACICHC